MLREKTLTFHGQHRPMHASQTAHRDAATTSICWWSLGWADCCTESTSDHRRRAAYLEATSLPDGRATLGDCGGGCCWEACFQRVCGLLGQTGWDASRYDSQRTRFIVSIPVIALSHGLEPLFFGRLLQGVSGGLIGVVVPLYLAECFGGA